jgi:hypothetical protein
MNIKSFIYSAVVVAIVAVFSVEIYQQLNPKKAKSSRLQCHENVTVFERIYHKDLVQKVQNAVKAGNITVNTRIEKSQYMTTQLFEHISQEQIEQKILTHFASKKTMPSSDDNVVIDILIYENDKKDPKKKNADAKKYAGYLTFEYKIDAKVVYRFQIDFMDMQARDIDDRIDCAVQSVMSIKG